MVEIIAWISRLTSKWRIKNGGIKCKQTRDANSENREERSMEKAEAQWRKNITATKSPTNLLTLRLNFWQFLRVGRVTRNEDICGHRPRKKEKRLNLQKTQE